MNYLPNGKMRQITNFTSLVEVEPSWRFQHYLSISQNIFILTVLKTLENVFMPEKLRVLHQTLFFTRLLTFEGINLLVVLKTLTLLACATQFWQLSTYATQMLI